MFVGGIEARGGGWRAAMACDGVVGRDGQVGAGILYPRAGAVADCMTGLSRVTRYDCSVARWKRKSTKGWKHIRVLGAGGPLCS